MSGLRECGHNVAPILAAVGIEDAMLDNPDGWVPTSVAITLLNYAVEQTGDAHAVPNSREQLDVIEERFRRCCHNL